MANLKNSDSNDRRFQESDEDDLNDDVQLCTKMLKDAYNSKKFSKIDGIISDIVSKSTIDGLTKLHSAAGYGFPELVERYLNEDKIDPNSECLFNQLGNITPMHFCAGIGPDAITTDRPECIELLKKYGANINKCTTHLDTPLHWASKISDREICEKFIKCGSDLSVVNLDSCTCAHGAAFYKNLDVLELLIDNKIDVKITDSTGKTILHLLCKDSLEPTSFVAMTEYSTNSYPASLKNDSRNASDKPINKKTSSQLIDIITKLILKFKMNPNEKDNVGFTPFMYACEYGNIELINLLIKYGADVNLYSDEGITCMLLAIVNANSNVVKCLLKNGFKLKEKSIQSSYLTDAAYLNDLEIVNILIEAGIDVNETKEDENGAILNPLWAVCERSNLDIATRLLECGANVIIRPDINMTALHCVAMAQYESVVIAELLVKYKCPLNMHTKQAGETPLFLACNSGFAELAEYLLTHGVNPNEAAAGHRTCFQQAIFRGYKNIIMLLLSFNYKLTEDDYIDMNLLLMDLYQDNDIEMLNYLLDKKLTNYETILKAIEELSKNDGTEDDISSVKKNTNITTVNELLKYLKL
jgi:ankyrin repeat protein